MSDRLYVQDLDLYSWLEFNFNYPWFNVDEIEKIKRMPTTVISNAGLIAKTLLFDCFPLVICIFIQENNKHNPEWSGGSLKSVLD